jgi:hypothetical protein
VGEVLGTHSAAVAIKEARAIADRLCCQPLLERAVGIAPAKSAIADQVAAPPDLKESIAPTRGHAGHSALITPDRTDPE